MSEGPLSRVTIGAHYKHYKGDFYWVHYIATLSDSPWEGREVVVYESLKLLTINVRTLQGGPDSWCTPTADGQERFTPANPVELRDYKKRLHDLVVRQRFTYEQMKSMEV